MWSASSDLVLPTACREHRAPLRHDGSNSGSIPGPSPGLTLYNFERLLGQGTSGSAWAASDWRTGEKSVVKVANVSGGGRAAAEDIAHEFFALAKCTHSNIVKAHALLIAKEPASLA